MSQSEKHIPDIRSYAFHQKAAEKLLSEPVRIEEVLTVLEHWSGMEDTQAQGWALKWLQLIDGLSVPEIAELIVRKSEEMDFYRKSSPFSCLLTDQERMEIIGRFKYHHEQGTT